MKWFLVICGVGFLVAGMVFGYLGEKDLLVFGFWGCIAFLVTANLDRISQFKASANGIEANTRDIVARAEIAVSELQLLAVHVAELSLSLVKRQGRLGGYNDEEQDRIRFSVLDVLTKLSIPQNKTQHVLDEWHRIVEFDYTQHILGGTRIPSNVPSDAVAEWKKLRSGGIAAYPSSQELRDFLNKYHFMTAELDEYLKDYDYYCKSRTHRRPSSWKARHQWGHLQPRST